MNSEAISSYAAPAPAGNWLRFMLQAPFWAVVRPGAWRGLVRRIDPELRPDFALVDLRPEHWRHPLLRRILLGLFLWPLASGLLAAGLSRLAGADPGVTILASLMALGYGLAAGMVIALAASAGAGIAAGCLVSLAGGLALSNGLHASPLDLLMFVIAAGVIGSAAGHLPGRPRRYPLARQVGGVLVGVVIGVGTIIIAAALGLGATMPIGVITRTGVQSNFPHVVTALVTAVFGGVVSAVALEVRVARQWPRGLMLGGLVGLVLGLLSSFAPGLGGVAVSAVWLGLALGALFVLPYLLAERVGGPWAGAVAGMLGSGAAAFMLQAGRNPVALAALEGANLALTLTSAWLWPIVFYPLSLAWNLLLFRLDERRPPASAPQAQAGPGPAWLRWHSAFWNEHQRWRLVGLDEHLVLVWERDPVEARAALEALAGTPQRWAVQAAQVELDARRLERCADVAAFGQAHRTLGAGELAGPASALLRSFSRVSQDVEAALQQESAYNQRLALAAVEDRLDGLVRELDRGNERYAVRFRPVATDWRQVVADHIRRLAAEVEQRQEIDSPYVIGVPLTAQQEIFVGRTDVSARIEQLLLDRRRPPLLLWGQRRMGKTSLLNNLGRLLPSTIVPLFVDLQGPASRAPDHAGFLYNLARGMADSAARERGLDLPPLTRERLAADPFTHFDEWLDEVEAALGESTALLALDEFEVLESAINAGRFNESDLLGMLRHLIQHRPRFKMLLSGSHTLEELQRWSSYLINVQVVKIGYLRAEEARQLVEQPVQGFALRYDPSAAERVLALTRGHPFLVQLLCAEIVALKNEQDPAVRRQARLEDVEAAVPEALAHGSFFFADVERNQTDEAGRQLLRFLAGQGEAAIVPRASAPGGEQALAGLLRRDLVEVLDGNVRFQVELIRRWFDQK